ncbi:uncharacterized protein LOC127508498 [Ctenopharyngodon idella]|uniref:uncharacterized protein LOC127508498 n=1 Tax=Ctenopharyngodon idella TaxID=7959 RepID=UPI00222E70B9|nr:uncharacterized protein LOC127508498 [Ctenopharyngodon idella]
MFFAFIFWGLTEGYLNETVTCCALYILRPVMLIWALPCLKYLQDNLKSWTRLASITREFAVLTAVVYSVLFKCGWDRSSVPGIIYGIFFGIVLLLCLRIFRRGFTRIEEKWGRLCFLPVAQFIQLMFSLGSPNLAFLAVALVQSLLLLSIPCLIYRRRWIILCMIPLMLLDIILVIYVHVQILEREKDYLEWICVFVFLEVLRIMVIFEDQDYEAECSGVQQHTERREQGSNALPLCNEIMYMFGAVGLVLLNSVTLTAELLLKTRHGERVLKDLRVVVFSSECFYILYWLVFQVHTFWKIKPESIHIGRNLLHRCYLKNTPETREMVNLSATDSAVSQTELEK